MLHRRRTDCPGRKSVVIESKSGHASLFIPWRLQSFRPDPVVAALSRHAIEPASSDPSSYLLSRALKGALQARNTISLPQPPIAQSTMTWELTRRRFLRSINSKWIYGRVVWLFPYYPCVFLIGLSARFSYRSIAISPRPFTAATMVLHYQATC